jgi:hypothetical protein
LRRTGKKRLTLENRPRPKEEKALAMVWLNDGIEVLLQVVECSSDGLVGVRVVGYRVQVLVWSVFRSPRPSSTSPSVKTERRRRQRRRPVQTIQASLEDQALALLVTATPATAAVQQSSAGGMLKDLANTLVGLGGALEVLESTDLLADLLTLQANIVSITAGLLTSQ